MYLYIELRKNKFDLSEVITREDRGCSWLFLLSHRRFAGGSAVTALAVLVSVSKGSFCVSRSPLSSLLCAALRFGASTVELQCTSVLK